MHSEKARKLDSKLWRANRSGDCYLVAAALPASLLSLTETMITYDQWGIPTRQELPLKDELLLATLQEIITYKLHYNVLWFGFQAIVTPILDVTDGSRHEQVYFQCHIAASKEALHDPLRSLTFFLHDEHELIAILRSDIEPTRYASGDKKRSVIFDTDPEEKPLWDLLEALTLTFSEVQRVYQEVKRTTRSKREDVLWLRIALACLDIQRKVNGEERPSNLELDLMELLRNTSKQNLQTDPRFRQRLVSVEDLPAVSYDLRFAWDPGRRPRSPRYRPGLGKEKAA